MGLQHLSVYAFNYTVTGLKSEDHLAETRANQGQSRRKHGAMLRCIRFLAKKFYVGNLTTMHIYIYIHAWKMKCCILISILGLIPYNWYSTESLSFADTKEFQKVLIIRRHISAFKISFHHSLYWTTSIQSLPPHSPPLQSSFILSDIVAVVSLFLDSTSTAYVHSSSSHACYISCPYPPWLHDNSNCTWRKIQIMKLPLV